MRWLRVRFSVRAMILAVAFIGFAISIVCFQRNADDDQKMKFCSTNLRNIGLALENYRATKGHFPPGALGRRDVEPEGRPSWCAAMLTGLDYQVTVTLDANGSPWPSFDGPASQFRCPNAPEDRHSVGPGLTNYVGVAGLGIDSPSLPAGHWRAGIFGYDRHTRAVDITDGLADTMMVAETMEEGPYIRGGHSTVRGLDPSRRPYIGGGRQFGGFHRRGAMVLFADGSVRAVGETIDPRVFEAISTIAGGETTGRLPGDH